MALHQTLTPRSPWVELKTTAEDWSSADPSLLASMLTSMSVIRAFEGKVLELAAQGLVHGPAHSAIGQEAAAAAPVMAMRVSDAINGPHRAHHQFLAKSLHFLEPHGLSPAAPISSQIADLCQKTLAEVLGLAPGFCKGRGGSMHLRWAEAGNLGTNAIVGGGVPMAAGVAWAKRRAGSGDVVFTYFGDGATNIGSVLETMNLAAAWKLPVCFLIENNLYAVATTVAESTAEPRLSARGSAFAIPAWKVDGMDPLAVYLAAAEAADVMRRGDGPTLIEADVYRFFHQNGSHPGSAFGYRTKAEESLWRQRDPIVRVAKEMVDRGRIEQSTIDDLRARAKALMDTVAEQLLEPIDGTRRIRPHLWPKADFRDVGIRGDLSELGGVRCAELETFQGRTIPDARFIDVVADLMLHRMRHDDRIVVMGEDIHKLKGGTNGATRGLVAEFPDRVLGTPICENAFVGLAGGIAMEGKFIPVVEFMYPDFLWVAADQLFNQIAKARHMFGGDLTMPLVLRTKVAMGTGYGSQHSMDPTGIFATSVGWRIVAPSTPFDYVGLMNSALRCNDPVLVVEHVDLYASRGVAPVDDLDYFIPFGKAKVVREGSGVTVLAYLNMVRAAVDVADRHGIDAEVIDLRSLDFASLDWRTIEASVAKTGNVIVVEQGSAGPSYGGNLASRIQDRCFEHLNGAVRRVHGGEASPSASKVLEAAACAGAEDIEKALRECIVGPR